LDFEARIKIHRDRIRRGEYQFLGMLSVISLDKEKGQRLPQDQARRIGRVIDLMGNRVPLAVSNDFQDLLLPAGFPAKLPQIVDPNYGGRTRIDEPTPYIEQTWADRASGETYIDGRNMIVAQPVAKLIILNDQRGPCLGKSAWPIAFCRADPQGLHMTFLLDPRKGDAYLVGGVYQFSTRLARADASPQLALSTA